MSMLRLGCLASLALALAACASPPHPLEGRIVDTRSMAFAAREALIAEAAATPYVILGEKHDNAGHHRLQREIVAAMLARGARPALAFEQFDREHQEAISAAQAAPRPDAEAIAAAGRLDRKAWRWPGYAPLVGLALDRGLPIVAANLSRVEARAIMREPSRAALAPAAPPVHAALERDLVEGHCGQRPGSLAGMIKAQRARDAQMAHALAAHPAAVLIAGSGHARRDRGAPLYLPAGTRVLSVAFLEIDEDIRDVRRYDGIESFDYVWFTAAQARADPCAGRPLVAPAP
jgi:uncharacterized iron-regulated protein